MEEIVVVSIYYMGMAGLGLTVLKRVCPKDLWSLKDLIIAAGIGMALLSALLIGLGLVGVINAATTWGIIAALICLFIWHAQYLRVPIPKWPDFAELAKLFTATNVLTALIILSCLGALFWTGRLAYLRPPFGDADAFYMNYARVIAHSGHLQRMPFVYEDFSSIGLMGELHYAALMTIASPAASKVLAWAVGVNALMLLIVLTIDWGGRILAVGLTAAVFFTSTTVTDYLSDGKTDLFSLAAALTLVALINRANFQHLNIGLLIFTGILSGIISYSKISYILCLGPAIAFFFIAKTRVEVPNTKAIQSILRSAIWVGIGFCLGLLPHIAKNYLLFGHGLAPFFGMENNWTDQPSWHSPETVRWILFTYPFALVFGQYPLMGGNMSPLWLAAFPFAFFAYLKRDQLPKSLFSATIAGAIGLVIWLLLQPSVFVPRYFLANLLLLVPICAIGFELYTYSSTRSRMVVLVFMILTVFGVVTMRDRAPAGVWTALPGFVNNYVKSGQPQCGMAISDYCRIFTEMKEKIPDDSRVFVLGYYTYDLDIKHFENINSNDETIFLTSIPENAWSWLNEQGFQYLFIQTATHGHFIEQLDGLVKPNNISVRLLYEGTNMPVFKIEDTGSNSSYTPTENTL